MFKQFRLLALAATVLFAVAGTAFAQVTDEEPTVTFVLTTGLGAYEQGAFAFLGTEGELEGVDNPDLVVKVGDVVRVVLISGDAMRHDFRIDDLGVATEYTASQGDEVSVTFVVTEAGEFEYYCSEPGHQLGGMYGRFIVEAAE